MTVSCALALAVAVGASPGSTTTPQCSDPCLTAARSTAKQCASSAHGAFQDALDGCLEYDKQCVDACRFVQQGCRDETSLGVDLAACEVGLGAAKLGCRNQHPSGSLGQAACLYRAEAANDRCRRDARRRVRREFRQCRVDFRGCAAGCGPGGPPGGAESCTAAAHSGVKTLLVGCRHTRQVMATACLAKDLPCAQSCIEARETCTAPTRTTLDAAITSCLSQAAAAIAACQSANPGGGTAFDDCVETAQANATACRDAALDAAAPGFAACGGPYLACVRTCPPGTT